MFREEKLVVNRAYQRKLVWTVDEKVGLIDSILKGYPIPLLLLLQRSDGKYEIIDGMQRLNAIMSFIETGFPLKNGKYFNINEFPTAKDYAETHKFIVTDSKDLLPRHDCAAILDYVLAVTQFTVNEASDVTDIFGRINSGGKQLSPQEQRQAGVTSVFARMVRRLCSELRGDVSEEIVNLAEMPLVSIDAPTLRLGYGVHAENTFWCKQGVLRTRELRDSDDEQFVADVAASILLEEPFNASRERFDEAYDETTTLHSDLESRLIAYDERRLSREIKTVFSVVVETIEACDSNPNAFRKVVNPKAGGNPVRTPFFAVVMAFHGLVIRQKKQPINPHAIMNAISGLASKLETASHHVKKEDRQKNINVVIGLIQEFFSHREPPLLGHGPGLAVDFENSLRRSRIETPRYEFKQGLLRLNGERRLDDSVVDRIVQTACGIANLGPKSSGYIFLGVADKESDASRIRELDGVAVVQVDRTWVVGIDREAKLLEISVEQYVRKLVAGIRRREISEGLRQGLLGGIDTVVYRNLSVIRISVPSQSALSWIGDKTFTREGSETIEASGRMIEVLTSRFTQ
jgi:hypothetical protein